MAPPTDNEILEKLEDDVLELIEKKMEENAALEGVNVGTHGGTLISSRFKEENEPTLSKLEIAAATSSMLFLSSKMLKGTLSQKISHSLIAGKENYILNILTDQITMTVYLNRELAELDGISNTINTFKTFALQISAVIETSELLKEEIFGAIKRAIPNALVIAIITYDGLPIKVQSTMAEPMLSAMISAVYNLADILTEESHFEYNIIFGDNGSIIIHELDGKRILCVAVPEADEQKVGSYIVKIKSIIKK